MRRIGGPLSKHGVLHSGRGEGDICSEDFNAGELRSQLTSSELEDRFKYRSWVCELLFVCFGFDK